MRAVRAAHHLDEARAVIASYRREHPNPVRILIPEEQVATGQYRPILDWASGGIPPRLELSILVGEFAYNLRAALDYLVHQLARLDGASARHRYFPIERDPKQWAKRRDSSLAGIKDEHVEIVLRHQPFRGYKWLSLLRAINNPDKHQSLTVVASEFTTALTIVSDHLVPASDHQGFFEVVNEGQAVRFLLLDSIDLETTLHALLFRTASLLDEFRPVFDDRESFSVSDPGVEIG